MSRVSRTADIFPVPLERPVAARPAPMTPAEAFHGWCLMTSAARRAFAETLTTHGIVSKADAAALVLAPLRVVSAHRGLQ